MGVHLVNLVTFVIAIKGDKHDGCLPELDTRKKREKTWTQRCTVYAVMSELSDVRYAENVATSPSTSTTM